MQRSRGDLAVKRLIVIVLIIFFSSVAGAAEGDRVDIGEFSAGRLDGWEVKVFTGETRYQLTQRDGTGILRAESRSSASGLVRKIKIDLKQYPFLNWRWRIETPLNTEDEESKAGDDYAARIYVVVDGGLLFWNTRAINYVWAHTSPKGKSWPNAYAGSNAMMLALRSNQDNSSLWYSEKRNVFKDFQMLFGKEIRYIDAVALMTDTDDSRGQAVSFYGDIFFSSR